MHQESAPEQKRDAEKCVRRHWFGRLGKGDAGSGGGEEAKDAARPGVSNLRLALLLVFTVLGLVAAGLYAYEYALLPGDVSAFVALTAIFPLTYLAYLGFAADAHRKRLEDDFRLLGLAREEDLSRIVSDLYKTVYSPAQFVVYIGLVVLISLVVFWAYLRCSALGSQCLPGLDSRTVNLVFYSYLGAYVFSVQELVRRYNTFDLQPQVYSSAAVRMLIAVAIVFAAASIILAEASAPPATGAESIWPAAVAFTIGVFPTQGLHWIARLGSRLISPTPAERVELPLGNLLGVSTWHEARLAQMGIDDAQNLATVDIRRLLLTTQFDTQEIASWIDQAILYVKVGDKLTRFREARIATDYELRTALAQLALVTPTPLSQAQQEARKEGRERLVVALGLTQSDELGRLADNANFPNSAHIAEYYARASQVAHERASAGMDKVLGPIVAELGMDLAAGTPDKQGEEEELRRHVAVIRQMLDRHRQDARLWNTLGAGLYRLGCFDDALGAFEEAIELDRDLVEPYHQRSLVQIEQGRYDEAIRSCTEAIRMDRAHAKAFNNRGLAYMELGYLDLALADLNEALRLDERLPNAYLNRGVTYNACGRFAEALQDFERGYLLNDRAAHIWLPWGLALIGVEDYRAALDKLSKAVIFNPVSGIARARRGYVYYHLERYAQARLDLEKALDMEPDLLVARSNLGLLEARVGNHEAAIEQYNQVLNTAPDQYVTRYNLALVYRRVGKRAEACGELRTVVETAPEDSVEARDAWSRLDRNCPEDLARIATAQEQKPDES